MRILSDQFQAHLGSDVTTLCHCWKIIRKDGFIIGFTDHDQDLLFNNIIYHSQPSIIFNSIDNSVNLTHIGSNLSGYISSDLITDDDIQNHLYDQASLETWLVNWNSLDQNCLLDISVFTRISQGDHSYNVEIKSCADMLDQNQGRLYQIECPLILGDSKCGVNLNDSKYSLSTTIVNIIDSHTLIISAQSYPAGWFSNGILSLTHNSTTQSFIIRDHQQTDTTAIIILWDDISGILHSNTLITMTAGCNKSFNQCVSKFNNQANYRGFPHIPGLDILMSFANQNDIMDGGSLFK